MPAALALGVVFLQVHFNKRIPTRNACCLQTMSISPGFSDLQTMSISPGFSDLQTSSQRPQVVGRAFLHHSDHGITHRNLFRAITTDTGTSRVQIPVLSVHRSVPVITRTANLRKTHQTVAAPHHFSVTDPQNHWKSANVRKREPPRLKLQSGGVGITGRARMQAGRESSGSPRRFPGVKGPKRRCTARPGALDAASSQR